MKIWKTCLGIAALFALAALPAHAAVFPASNDGWSTPGGGETHADLSHFNAAAILGSAPLSNTVNLKGKPLDSANLGTIDTLLERGAVDTSVSSTGTLKIVALSLESDGNVTLADGRVYHLTVTLSSTPASPGSITLATANGDGGTFDASFDILPKLTFTNVNPPYDVVNIDCGSGGCSPFTLASSGTGWVQTGGPGGFNPDSHGVTPIRSGVTVQGYTTIGRPASGAIYPGFTASASTGFPPSPVNEQDLTNRHNARPVQDCLSNSTRTGFSTATGKSLTIGNPSPDPGPGPGPSPNPTPVLCFNSFDTIHNVNDVSKAPAQPRKPRPHR